MTLITTGRQRPESNGHPARQAERPGLVGILAERRSVLAWAGYVRGNEARQADVECLRRTEAKGYRPARLSAHAMIEYVGRDRMNPDVRDRLELVFRNRDVALYRVPDGLWAGQ